MMQVPVLIVGGGPAGLSASLMLSRLGIRNLLVERRPTGSTLPRAHIVNHRTMEIFRELGLEEAVRTGSTSPDHIEFVVCTGLAGQVLAKTNSWGMRPDAQGNPHDASPCMVMNHSQDGLERILRDAAEQEPLASIAFGHELVSVMQAEQAVRATVREESGATYDVEAQYLLGCDGARSIVRSATGIGETGMSGQLSILYAHFRADLTKAWQANPGVLYTIFNEALRGTGLVLMREPDEWILSVPLSAHDTLEAVNRPEILTGIIRQATGILDLEPHIVLSSPWELGAVVADQFRKGRMFLCGDAAHRMPPASGLGMNSAIHDTYNLCWKLAAVLTGAAHETLLDSYERERRPTAQRNTFQSLANAIKLMAIEQAAGYEMGTPPDQNAGIYQQLIADDAMGQARRSAIEAAVDAMHDMTDALDIDLGVTYTLDGDPEEYGLMNLPDPRAFIDQAAPGRRVPHAWVQSDDRACRVSTLDLVGKGQFTLLCGPAGAAWCDVQQQMEALYPACGVHIVDEIPGHRAPWIERCGISDNGALLVRPDGVVLSIIPEFGKAQVEDVLTAMQNVLGRLPLRG